MKESISELKSLFLGFVFFCFRNMCQEMRRAMQYIMHMNLLSSNTLISFGTGMKNPRTYGDINVTTMHTIARFVINKNIFKKSGLLVIHFDTFLSIVANQVIDLEVVFLTFLGAFDFLT
jgi:hypothetical protein|tara:strand:- start:2751 stop:3107 length:357 start_codon:yes stop_codon:yes gene_type:complete